MSAAPGDTELMIRCGGGDRAAFEELVRRYETRLIPYIRSIIRDRDYAEDLFQETFFRIHRQAPQYVPKARLSTYILTVARHLCFSFLQKKRESPVELDEAAATSSYGGPTRRLEMEELKEAVAEALSRLPREHREAVTLRYQCGMSFKAIAEIMQSPLGTVASWVYQGQEKLASELEEFAPLLERERGNNE
jgi:RNA polymerase sigma-70 factor (ECF subfamily)